MSKMAELDMMSYDIEQLYIEGANPGRIAEILDIQIEMVYAWMEINGVAEAPQEVYDPFETINS
jgi:hypothetical protein